MCQVVDNNSNQPQRIFRPKLQPTDITIVLGRKSACISLGRASGIAFLGAVMKPFGLPPSVPAQALFKPVSRFVGGISQVAPTDNAFRR